MHSHVDFLTNEIMAKAVKCFDNGASFEDHLAADDITCPAPLDGIDQTSPALPSFCTV